MRKIIPMLFAAVFIWHILAGTATARGATGDGMAVDCPERVLQGEAFLVRIASDAPLDGVRLIWLGREVRPPVETSGPGRPGHFEAWALLGAGPEQEPGPRTLEIRTATRSATRAVDIGPRKFPEQRLTLPETMVTPPAEVLARIKAEKDASARVLALATPARYWGCSFVRPVAGRVSGAFGLRRVLNGKPRQGHRGVNFAAAAGEPVAAATGGRVAMVAEHYFEGRTVYLDHGGGVVTVYCHLSETGVQEGQAVRAGQTIGRVGSSGRATGPHLHFGLVVLGQAVDPQPLFQDRIGACPGSQGEGL